MSFIGLLVIVIVLTLAGGLVRWLLPMAFGGRDASDSSASHAAPGMTLNCPTCGQETSATHPMCQRCGAAL